ncbi:MAG: peptidoglycan DD-metalloendopeptidase family protein [Candidatus Moraniibacteriota bacterium]
MIVLQPNKNKKYFLCVALLCGSVLFSAWAQAADTGALSDQLDAINAKIKAYKQIIDLKQRQGSTLADQIQSLEAQANKLQLEIDLNKQKLDDLEGNITLLSSRIAEKEAVANSQKQMLSELMRLYYSDYSNPTATLILSSNETLALFNQESWTTELGGKVGELLDLVKTLRANLISERLLLETKKQEADTLHAQLNARNDYLESTKENKSSLLTKTQAEATKYNNLVDDLEKQRAEIEDEINQLESGKLDELNLKDMPSFKHGLLAYPLKTHTLSQGYGKTSFAKSSKFYKNGFHNGLDFSTPTGTPVLAAADGKVVAVGNNGRYAYGRYIAIDHGNGIITMYGHLSASKVSRGATVKKGDVIAKSGSTGNSTGPHVHFTVFSAKTFDIVASIKVPSVKDIPIGATVNPSVYLP